jgi:hypothetical protein
MASANGRGYLGGNRSGNDCTGQTFGNENGSTYRSAGSYGGLDGTYLGTPNSTYGSLTIPAALGSGGGCGEYSYIGGGRIAITCQDLTIASDKIQSLGGSGKNSTGGNGTVYFDPR